MVKEELTFDATIFEESKLKLNRMLQQLTAIAMQTGKVSEINLKIAVDVYANADDTYEPRYEIKLNNKIKENKEEVKGIAGINNQVFIDEDGNVYLQEMNKQIEIGEEE